MQYLFLLKKKKWIYNCINSMSENALNVVNKQYDNTNNINKDHLPTAHLSGHFKWNDMIFW